jgi:hypothetical protein
MMIFSSGFSYLTGLILASVILLLLVRWLSTRLSGDSDQEKISQGKKIASSNVWTVALVLLSFMLVISIGSSTGAIIWVAIKGIAEGAVTIWPENSIGAITGAATSLISFGLFALVLSAFGPILSTVYEKWTEYIAPVVGGTIGAAISGGLGVSVVYILFLSTVIGGIALVCFEIITSKMRVTFKGISELVIAGLGFGFVNGVILTVVFKVIDVSLGLDWMIAG